jgi:hypothetical protein
MRDDAEAVAPEENGAAACLVMCGVDARRHRGCRLATPGRFAEPARYQHHRLDRVGFDDLVDQSVHGIGVDGDDQQIESSLRARAGSPRSERRRSPSRRAG